MRLVRGLHRWQNTEPCAVTIGNFDGAHLGHQAMIKQLVKSAHAKNLKACVISFEPLPHEYFTTDNQVSRLNGFRDRVKSIEAQGVDTFLLLNFDQAQAMQSAEDFITDVLVNKIRAKHVLIGDDFKFGHKRQGDFALLQTYEQQGHFTLSQYETVSADAARVSSTRIRQHLQATELDAVEALLGQRYQISGRVVHGEKVGRQLGFPTANISLKSHRPALSGVFAVVAHDQTTEKSYAGVANLGVRPTVDGLKLLLEVHMLNSKPDLYGHHINVEFIEYLRGEQKFDSLDALKEAISNDSDTASRILNGNPEFTYLANRIHLPQG